MFFKAGDPVWAKLPSGEVPDVVTKDTYGYCDEHPNRLIYGLESNLALCGSLLRPRIDPHRNVLSLLDLTPLEEKEDEYAPPIPIP